MSETPRPEPTPDDYGMVLVVDDDRQSVDIVSKLLGLEKIRSVQATSGRQCLEIARRQPIDVILLDVMMPEMDGLEVSAELRADERTRSIPILLLTAKDDYETRAAGMRVGVSEFLSKPVNKGDLHSRVKAHLRIQAMSRQLDLQLAKIPST